MRNSDNTAKTRADLIRQKRGQTEPREARGTIGQAAAPRGKRSTLIPAAASRPPRVTLAQASAPRERRSAAARAQEPATRTRYNAVIPPMTMRNGYSTPRGGAATPMVNRTRTQVRRKLSISLGTPGAEMVFPSLPIIKFGWRLISGSLMLLLSFVIIFICTSTEFQVGTPEISGIKRIDPTDITTLLRFSGTPIFMIDPFKTTKIITDAYPELVNVSVKVVPPAKVVISASERDPFIAWEDDTQIYWIDKQGVIFPSRGELKKKILTIKASAPPPVKSIEDIKPEDVRPAIDVTQATPTPSPLTSKKLAQRQIDPIVMDALITLGKKLPAGTDLAYNTTEGLGWTDPNGWQVYVGPTLEDLDLKLAIYEQIVVTLKKNDIRPKMVSVAYVNAPFYRLE